MKRFAILFIVALLVGCAAPRGTGANYSPIVDRPGENYAQDLAACQQHATKVLAAGDAAVNGAVAGAIFGALFSAAVGGGRYRNNYIAAGALGAGARAASDAEGGQRGIITRCLAGRGYMVLQ